MGAFLKKKRLLHQEIAMGNGGSQVKDWRISRGGNVSVGFTRVWREVSAMVVLKCLSLDQTW